MWNTQENSSKPNPEAYLKDYNQWPQIYSINVRVVQNAKSNQYNTLHYRMGGGSCVHFQWSLPVIHRKKSSALYDKKHLTSKEYR